MENILVKAFEFIKEKYKEEKIISGEVIKIAIKPQWNVILGSNGQCGQALNFTGEHSVYEFDKKNNIIDILKDYVGKPLFDLADTFINSEDIRNRAIGLAALNALSQPLIDKNRLKKEGVKFTDKELVNFTTKDDVVTVIGFGGVVRQFLDKCRELHVTEMRSKSMFETIIIGEKIEIGPKNIFIHPAEENKEILSKSDVVLITGSTLVNDTFYEVLRYCKNARIINIYGPSAQLPPDFLFQKGINHIRSMKITDVKQFGLDMENDPDLEGAIKANQEVYNVYNF
jgi:uncharacterized protein